MNDIEKYFAAFIILLNIATILGFIVGRMNYKNGNNTKFIANLSLFVGICFLIYTLSLFIFSLDLILHGRNVFGFVILGLSSVPFIIGKISTYNKADYFINLQIFALALNMIVICRTY